MEEKIPDTRVRMNLTTTAKGKVQLDITAEFPTLEESAKNLDAAIKEAKRIVAENGMELASEAK